MDILERNHVIFVVLISTLIIGCFSAVFLCQKFNQDPFFVGVSYCGESVEQAKLLIDKVKSYTNLFVLQSGPLQEFPDKINEICDYAVSSGLYFIVYFGIDRWWSLSNWLETCEDRWGERFLGVYYGDELGGKMLDSEVQFWDENTSSSIIKYSDGEIQGVKVDDQRTMNYWPDGKIELIETEANTTYITYYPNGTITAEIREFTSPFDQIDEDYIIDNNGTINVELGNYTISPIQLDNFTITYSYQELWNMRLFKTYDEIAEKFLKYQTQRLTLGPKNETKIPAFLADYVLYWFDYKSGYDVVFASFGWNQTLIQDIALIRGAAEVQNKKWGAIITWKYNYWPYLDSGEEIYNQMQIAYETGAEYVVIFNYAEDMEGPYGTLRDEHFVALEQFWKEVVQSSEIKHGSIETEAVLVLPENYGWGMRFPDDKIWGLWGPDEKSSQIWELSRNLIEQYGLGLDIIYDDSEFLFEGKYNKIYYWDQTI